MINCLLKFVHTDDPTKPTPTQTKTSNQSSGSKIIPSPHIAPAPMPPVPMGGMPMMPPPMPPMMGPRPGMPMVCANNNPLMFYHLRLAIINTCICKAWNNDFQVLG